MNEKRLTLSSDNDVRANHPQVARALSFVRDLLHHMGMEAEVNIAPEGDEHETDEVHIEIEGPDAGRVIGKRGLVLEAIQYLTTRVSHQAGEIRKHIVVDAEGYRARHEEQLSQMSKKLGMRVAKEGKIITFDPMNARDRRVVHMALKDVPFVRTESNGMGMDRRVQIIPDKSKTEENILAEKVMDSKDVVGDEKV